MMAIINLILSNTDVTRWNGRSYPISIHEEERDISTSISIFKNFAESFQNISRFPLFFFAISMSLRRYNIIKYYYVREE